MRPRYRHRVMDLFLYANENKSAEFEEQGKKMSPSEVIPMETCEVAEVAHTHKIQLISYNEDFKYFSGFLKTSAYVEYQSFDDFLKYDFTI